MGASRRVAYVIISFAPRQRHLAPKQLSIMFMQEKTQVYGKVQVLSIVLHLSRLVGGPPI